MTPYFNFILGWNMWNVWFGMKEGSGSLGCILYLISFSSEYTWVLFNGPNGHWVTPGQPSNTLFKSHNTQAQDLWTRRCWLIIFVIYHASSGGGGGGHTGGPKVLQPYIYKSEKWHVTLSYIAVNLMGRVVLNCFQWENWPILPANWTFAFFS